MRSRRRSSKAFSPCRLDWRPSRWVSAGFAAVALCGNYSLHLSAVPPQLALLGTLVLWLAAAAHARAWVRRPPRRLVVPWGRAPACVDGLPVADLQVQWRGPLAWVSWRRGPRRRECLLFCPDTLPPARRRELRLAARSRAVSPAPLAMAP